MNTNIDNENNTDLVSLIAMNTANAEDPDGDQCYKRPNHACYATVGGGTVIMHCDEDKWYTISNCY